MIFFTSHSLLYSVNVATEAELNTALGNGSTLIDFTVSITLTAPLRAVNSTGAFAPDAITRTINGSVTNSLFGAATYPGFFVRGGTLTVNNMVFSSTASIGGSGEAPNSTSGGCGGAAGYTYTKLLWRNRGGKGHLNSYYGALYASWFSSCSWSIDASIIGGGSDQDLDRKIVFSTVNRNAKSDFWSLFATGHLGMSGRWDCLCSTFEPYILADYHYYSALNLNLPR